MIPRQYVSLELRAWVFGCPFLRRVARASGGWPGLWADCPPYIPFWLLRAQRWMIPPQYVSLELRAWVFGCPFLRGVRRDGVLIWADKRERKFKSPTLPKDGRVGRPKFKIKAWATRPVSSGGNAPCRKAASRMLSFFRQVKRAQQRRGRPERPVHAAPPDVVETFRKAFFDVHLGSANHAVTIRHSRLNSSSRVIG